MLEITSERFARRGVLYPQISRNSYPRWALSLADHCGVIPKNRGLGLMDRGNAKRQRFRKTSLRGDTGVGDIIAGVIDLVVLGYLRPRP